MGDMDELRAMLSGDEPPTMAIYPLDVDPLLEMATELVGWTLKQTGTVPAHSDVAFLVARKVLELAREQLAKACEERIPAADEPHRKALGAVADLIRGY
jgi:hypothetical protein